MTTLGMPVLMTALTKALYLNFASKHIHLWLPLYMNLGKIVSIAVPFT